MSQKGRARRILSVLKYIAVKGSASVPSIYANSVGCEGVTLRRLSDYLKTLHTAGFIKLTGNGKWEITEVGEKFLERKK